MIYIMHIHSTYLALEGFHDCTSRLSLQSTILSLDNQFLHLTLGLCAKHSPSLSSTLRSDSANGDSNLLKSYKSMKAMLRTTLCYVHPVISGTCRDTVVNHSWNRCACRVENCALLMVSLIAPMVDASATVSPMPIDMPCWSSQWLVKYWHWLRKALAPSGPCSIMIT